MALSLRRPSRSFLRSVSQSIGLPILHVDDFRLERPAFRKVNASNEEIAERQHGNPNR